MIQSTLEEVKKTMSDSESDSGVGSVRTNDQSSENDSAGEQKKTVTLITPKTTNKTGKFLTPTKQIYQSQVESCCLYITGTKMT